MTSRADTIREALVRHHAVGFTVVWGGRCEVCDRYDPFAALTELEQRAEAKEPAGTYARITELQAINAQMTRHRDEQAARAEAAEADRDRYREALEQIAEYTNPENIEHDPFGRFVVTRMKEMARAALATPDTPSEGTA